MLRSLSRCTAGNAHTRELPRTTFRWCLTNELHKGFLLIAVVLVLAGCDKIVDGSNFTPSDKAAKYDPKTKALIMPGPCPDWSQTQTQNYRNEPHSDFGCAVNSNLAVQIENPQDLHHGHGRATSDTEASTSVIQQYREGKIPVPLTPLQSTGSSQ